MAKQIGWYRLYDCGDLGVQIMHYKMDGTPGQCCTVDRADLEANVQALETPWPQGRDDIEPMFSVLRTENFPWEVGRRT